MGRLDGKVAAVTGAGSGIGRGTALVLAQEGARVVLNDVNEEYLAAALAELPGEGHVAVAGDVSLEATSEAIVAAALERHGRLDVLVGNVGLMFFKDITEVSVEEFDRLMAVNVRGMVLACKHAVGAMLAAGGGSIVLVTSGSAYRGHEFGGVSTFAYNMSKAAVRQLATSLATRYAGEGIRVNAVAPGVTRTNQLRHFLVDMREEEQEAMLTAVGQQAPMGRYGTPEEIGEAIAFLASPEASYVTGATLPVDGGGLAR